jgi:hypothetical protein
MFRVRPDPPLVLQRGADRVANLRAALAPVFDHVDWPTRERVVLKPAVDAGSAVSVEALDTTLALIRDHHSGLLAVALAGDGGAALRSCWATVRRHGAEIVLLGEDRADPVPVCDAAGRPLFVARTVLESDCRIALSVPRTGGLWPVALSLANMVVGSVLSESPERRATERPRWLGGLRAALLRNDHLHPSAADASPLPPAGDMPLLCGLVKPHVGVLDGFVAFEGDGRPVPWGIALASADALAVDVLAADLMGFPLSSVPYLRHCAALGLGRAELARLRPSGNTCPEEVRRAFAPHPAHTAPAGPFPAGAPGPDPTTLGPALPTP